MDASLTTLNPCSPIRASFQQKHVLVLVRILILIQNLFVDAFFLLRPVSPHHGHQVTSHACNRLQ